MEDTEHTCEECGKEFSCIDEPNDDYRNRCGDCYKKMIQEDYDKREHDVDYQD